MDNKADERDVKLLEGDKYTFAVLSRILCGQCRLLLTDHERLIICHSENPFPVWIWTPDDCTWQEMDRAWDIVSQSCPVTDGYRYNLKYGLAEYFISKAKEQGINIFTETNMFAYDCPVPREPERKPDGYLHKCGAEDIEAQTEILEMFHNELEFDRQDKAHYRSRAEEMIRAQQLYFWKNAAGQTAASCHYTPNGGLVSIGGVYTLPEYRRKHYAENLVYEVTRIAAAIDAMPMLYTDADYIASNACYEKIGYVLRGKLCTIAADIK